MAKILIADDDRALLDVFSAAVESMGHSAIRAVNGRMAWEVLLGIRKDQVPAIMLRVDEEFQKTKALVGGAGNAENFDR